MIELPDRWWVVGTARGGEEINAEYDDRQLAEHVASKINGRGGAVTVSRLVFDGPGAAWFPEDHWRIKRRTQVGGA